MSFSQGIRKPRGDGATMFEQASLPDVQKRELCLGLLDEFGVRKVARETRDGELIHSCCVPNAGHKNGDRNASASLNWQKLTYNCFGCGSSGGLLWFIATCRGLDTPEAREWLGSKTGFGQSVMDLTSLIDLITQIFRRPETRSPIPSYSPAVLDPWLGWDFHHPYLTETGRIPGTRFLGRGIPESTLDHFRIGYADEYFDGSERIIIPAFWEGKLVGWQARCLPDDADRPDKYRNSPDFPRDRVLYNYDRDAAELLVVESPLSVLRHFHHLPQMCATFGAKVTDEQIRMLQRYQRVLLWFDNDTAGWEATKTVAEALVRHVPVSVVDSPYAADPADMDDVMVELMLTDRLVPSSIWHQPEKLIKWKRST